MKRTFILPGATSADTKEYQDWLEGKIVAAQETPEGLMISVTAACNLHRVSFKGHNLRNLEESYIIENSVAYKELLQVAETIIRRVQEGSIKSKTTYKACLRAVAFSQLSPQLAHRVQNMDWYYEYSDDAAVYGRGLALERELKALAEKGQRLEQVLALAPDDWSFST